MVEFIRPSGYKEALTVLQHIEPGQVVVFGIDKPRPRQYGIDDMEWAAQYRAELASATTQLVYGRKAMLTWKRRVSPTMPDLPIFEQVAIGLSPRASRFLEWIAGLSLADAQAMAR